MPFENINGIKVYYENHGDGAEQDTIVLLHHGFGCVKIWKEVYPALLRKGYRVIMYDRRGYGKSEKGPGFMDFYVSDRYRPESLEEMAALVDALDIDRFHLIGQCEGGVVAVDYASSFPDRVKSMVMGSTQCFSNKTMRELNLDVFPKRFRELEPQLRDKLTEWHAEDAELFYDQFSRFGGAYGAEYFDLRPTLSTVTCPALVLYPDRSSVFDVEQGLAMYRQLPKGELAVLPACGQNSYEYRPDDYARIALDFFKRHDEREGGVTDDMVDMSCLAVKKPRKDQD